jgi:hypothetical protein
MTTFDNHPPINFAGADEVASACRDGGAYSGIGHNNYRVRKGKKLHLTNHYSSGCDYGSGCSSSSTHLGAFDAEKDLIAHLLGERDEWGGIPWWVNEILEDLGYEGEEA